jgi:hypothetical protein
MSKGPYSSLKDAYEEHGEKIFDDLAKYLRPKRSDEKPYSTEYIRILYYKIKNRLWYLKAQQQKDGSSTGSSSR